MPAIGAALEIQWDPLSIFMTLIVTGVGTSSTSSPSATCTAMPGSHRFFTYLNLFAASMLTLVLAGNFAMLFLGWELVGLCSYLLISFWFTKPSAAAPARRPSSSTGSATSGSWSGSCSCSPQFGSLSFDGCFERAGDEVLGTGNRHRHRPAVPGRGRRQVGADPALRVAARRDGRSHAGVGAHPRRHHGHRRRLRGGQDRRHLRVGTRRRHGGRHGRAHHRAVGRDHRHRPDTTSRRCSPTRPCPSSASCSWRLGSAAYVAGIFHLMTHAFFKALLFLGAGSVIHGMHEEQDMRKMGGLCARRCRSPPPPWGRHPRHRRHPAPRRVLVEGRDPLGGLRGRGVRYQALWAIGLLTALLTAFYMTRQFVLVFMGEPRWDDGVHPHESPRVMTVPLVVLAGLLHRRRVINTPVPARPRALPRALLRGGRHPPRAPSGMCSSSRCWWPSLGIGGGLGDLAPTPPAGDRWQRVRTASAPGGDGGRVPVEDAYGAAIVAPAERVAEGGRRKFDAPSSTAPSTASAAS
jgi:NADH-quinone oxidoreductase subunit L